MSTFETKTERTAHLSESERFRVLKSERRRLVLDILSERTSEVTLDDLVSDVAAREEGLDPTDERDEKRVAISLHHRHLPKMADFDVLNYDPENRQVTL